MLYTRYKFKGTPAGSKLAPLRRTGSHADIDPDSYPSLKEAIEEAFSTYRPQPAFTNMGATLTYAQLDELSRAFALGCSASRGWFAAIAWP